MDQDLEEGSQTKEFNKDIDKFMETLNEDPLNVDDTKVDSRDETQEEGERDDTLIDSANLEETASEKDFDSEATLSIVEEEI